MFIHPNGRSTAFVINGAQGFDFFQLAKNQSGQLDLNNLALTVAHESHHLALKMQDPKSMSTADSLALHLLKLITAEGSATKFVDNSPAGWVPSIDPSRVSAFNNAFNGELGNLWQSYTKDRDKIFNRLMETLSKIYNNEINKADLNKSFSEYWLANAIKGPAYFIGSEIYGVIYYGLGKEEVFMCMQHPEKLLTYYNKAVKKLRKRYPDLPLVPKTLIKRLEKIGDRFQQLEK